MSSPRIIGGSARGVRLHAVPGDTTRPVTDMVKGAFFNIVGGDIYNACFLDVFGGTGSIGIEALSRGAAFARFLDTARPAVTTMNQNLELTRLKEKGEVLLRDAFTYLASTPDRRFEYIYIAPPQYKQLWQKALRCLDANPGWLTPDAWVAVQIHPVEYEELDLQHLREFEQRKYGSTLLMFYEIKTEA